MMSPWRARQRGKAAPRQRRSEQLRYTPWLRSSDKCSNNVLGVTTSSAFPLRSCKHARQTPISIGRSALCSDLMGIQANGSLATASIGVA